MYYFLLIFSPGCMSSFQSISPLPVMSAQAGGAQIPAMPTVMRNTSYLMYFFFPKTNHFLKYLPEINVVNL